MSSPERPGTIPDALRILRKQQRGVGKKGSRTHEETYLDRAAKLKALELGPCRTCPVLIIGLKGEGRFVEVSLRCKGGLSPLDLHRPYVSRLGEIPECDFLTFLNESAKARVPEENLI